MVNEKRDRETIWHDETGDAAVSWTLDYERTRYGDELQYGYDYLLLEQMMEGSDGPRRVWFSPDQFEAIVKAVRAERRKPDRM